MTTPSGRSSTWTRLTWVLVASLTCALSSAAIPGCGGAAATSTGGTVGRSRGERPGRRVELVVETTDGMTVDIEAQRGSPVLLVLFATYDGASIASQRPLAMFTREHLDTVVIAIATQPDAAVFAAQYDEVIDPPYNVAWDPAEIVAPGLSGLGTIDAIPAFIMVGPDGREVGRHYGYASRRVLERLWADATGGVPLDVPEPSPLDDPPPDRDEAIESGTQTDTAPDAAAEPRPATD